MKPAPNRKPMEGQKFNRLTVLSYHSTVGKLAYWNCRCDCGNEVVRVGSQVRLGTAKSCGCFTKEVHSKHGLAASPVYRTWLTILQRCHNPKTPHFKKYNALGVCEAIRESVIPFFECVGHKPSSKHTIDRIDNSLGYHCGKCADCVAHGWVKNIRWATRKEQSNNRNTTISVWDGESIKPITQIANETGISYPALIYRHKRLGLSGKDLIAPIKFTRKRSFN